jgi:hypothetical protein
MSVLRIFCAFNRLRILVFMGSISYLRAIFPFPDHPDHNGVRRPRSNFAFFVEKKIKFLLKCRVQFDRRDQFPES